MYKTKMIKWICESCAISFMLDKDLMHNVKCCPYCKSEKVKRVNQK